MDGTTYSIDVTAQAIGADATAADCNALADAIDKNAVVATQFDNALQATSAQLKQASAVAANAAVALTEEEIAFKRLERAAIKAAKALAKPKKGADVEALKVQAEGAAAAVTKQAAAVDKARDAASAAAVAEERLAKSYASVKKAAAESVSAQQKAADAQKEAKIQGMELLAQLSPTLGRYTQIAKTMGVGSLKTLAMAAAVLVLVAAVTALAVGAAYATVKLIKYAIATDKAATKRLADITKKAHTNLKGLFTDVKTAPLLDALESMADMLHESSSTGQALKKLLDLMLNPLIGGTEKLAPLLREMFKGAIYGAIMLAIAAYKVRNAILRAIPKETRTAIKELITGNDGLATSFKAGEAIFYVVAAVVGAAAVAFILLGVAVGIVVATAAFLLGGIAALIGALYKIGTAIKSAETYLLGLGKAAVSAAGNFISGLVDGIKNGGAKVIAAVASLAMGALGAFTGAFEISSHSKVMVEHGLNISGGATEGIEAGAPKAQSAMQQMMSPEAGAPKAQSAMQQMMSPEAGGSLPSVNQTNVSRGDTTTTGAQSSGPVTVYMSIDARGSDGDEIFSTFKARLLSEVEGLELILGASEVPV